MEHVVIHYADDDIDDLQLFKTAVEKNSDNVSVHTYDKTDDFLQSIRNGKAKKTIIFLDINMPGKSGFEILKEIRRDNLLKKIPVIMYSTSNDIKTVHTSKDIGATMYAVKPTSFVDLKNMIKKAININWERFESPPESFVLSAS
jgi:DNA-binding NtrC family response regulator